MTPVLFALAAAAGAVSRVELDRVVTDRQRSEVPWGILLANLLGSLALGIVIGLHRDGHLTDAVRTVLGTGFCGAFTTFSTFVVQALRLAERPEHAPAAGYVVATLAGSVAAAGIGLAIGGAV